MCSLYKKQISAFCSLLFAVSLCGRLPACLVGGQPTPEYPGLGSWEDVMHPHPQPASDYNQNLLAY